MNCKDGDLAIIVKTTCNPQYLGYVLRVKNLYESSFGAAWFIYDNNELIKGGFFSILDECLRSLRDSDKQDEMLSIINLKNKQHA